MTIPRRIPTPRTTFAVFRRVHDRRFLLRPDEPLTALVTWLLATLAPMFGVEVHAFTVMSSHFHAVVSVEDQRISELFCLFDALLAKSVNVLRRARRGIVWAPGELGIVECKTVKAEIFEIAYAIVNPVAAGLVWQPEDWPGLSIQVEDLGRRVLDGVRPGFFFDPTSWEHEASLAVTLPPRLLAEYGEEEARRRIAIEVKRQVAAAHADIRAKRWRVLGPVAARNVSPYRRAKTWETFGVIHPHFAAGPGCIDERIDAALELVTFRQEYRACWRRYLAGERDVVFPYGTYLMRVRHGVRVADPP
ncbi:MAG: transposase [Sandaracinaceae bacterium]